MKAASQLRLHPSSQSREGWATIVYSDTAWVPPIPSVTLPLLNLLIKSARHQLEMATGQLLIMTREGTEFTEHQEIELPALPSMVHTLKSGQRGVMACSSQTVSRD